MKLYKLIDLINKIGSTPVRLCSHCSRWGDIQVDCIQACCERAYEFKHAVKELSEYIMSTRTDSIDSINAELAELRDRLHDLAFDSDPTEAKAIKDKITELNARKDTLLNGSEVRK